MKVSIIGAGIIGKATGIGLAQVGHEVIFCDTNSDVQIPGCRIADISQAVRESEIHMICVPTPLAGDSLDLSFVKIAAQQVAEAMAGKAYQLVVLRSSVVPFTTRKEVIPILENLSPLELGKDYDVCYNPEFLRAAHSLEDFNNAPIVVIGETDKRSGDTLAELYAPLPAEQFRTSLENAEAIKCFSNVYNAMKVSFFNTVWLMAQKCGLDDKAISEAMVKTSLGLRWPEYYTKGGKPFDGTCLPKDLAASLSFLRENGLDDKLLEAVKGVNDDIMARLAVGVM